MPASRCRRCARALRMALAGRVGKHDRMRPNLWIMTQPTVNPRARRWLLILVSGLALFGLLVACGVAVVLRSYFSAVDRGEASPGAAAYAWILTFNDPTTDVGLSRLLTGDKSALLKQRRSYLQQIQEDDARTGWGAPRFSTNGGAQDTSTVDGDRGTATVWIEMESAVPNRPGLAASSPALRWDFTLRRADGSWRVAAFIPPPWCGGYSKCGPPAPASSPGSSPTPSFTLRPPPTPCGPDDPLRTLRSCPPSPAAPSHG
jgi:hypothetical protein